jgi:hypothetical protein
VVNCGVGFPDVILERVHQVRAVPLQASGSSTETQLHTPHPAEIIDSNSL